MVLGGANSLLDSVDVKGTPFLKNVPLLKYLFSEKASGRTDAKMLILVSPHIASDMGAVAPVSAGNTAIIEMSEKPAEERTGDRR
jgi:type II secretory pathway component GspD/PulD (secretin)